MAVVSQNLDLYEALMGKDPAEAEIKLRRARELARDSIALARDISLELRGTEAVNGIEIALENLTRASVPPGMTYSITTKGKEDALPDHVRDQLYLILREGIRNAVTHSESERIEVTLTMEPGSVKGYVRDYGRGFDAADGYATDGVGLKSMRERTSLLGGKFDLSPNPEGGTNVRVTIPIGNGRK